MIISHSHKFLFFAAGRTGTTSIEKCLHQFGSEFDLSEHEIEIYNKHIPPALLRARVAPEIWDNYFKFAFVRNPWDWVISRHFHGQKWRKEHLSLTAKISEADVRQQCEMKQLLRGITWADYRHQYAFLANASGTLQVDFVGRFESLQRDFDFICKKIGVPEEQSSLPKLNATAHLHYSRYYNESTKQLVSELYKKDIEHFCYEFEYE